jgi:hypothetical protein
MQVTFKPKSFDRFRGVEDVLKGRFGDTTYVGTNNMTVLVEYSPKLVSMLRPFPPEQVFDYELKMLTCKDCSVERPFVASKDETSFVCDLCTAAEAKRNTNRKLKPS